MESIEKSTSSSNENYTQKGVNKTQNSIAVYRRSINSSSYDQRIQGELSLNNLANNDNSTKDKSILNNNPQIQDNHYSVLDDLMQEVVRKYNDDLVRNTNNREQLSDNILTNNNQQNKVFYKPNNSQKNPYSQQTYPNIVVVGQTQAGKTTISDFLKYGSVQENILTDFAITEFKYSKETRHLLGQMTNPEATIFDTSGFDDTKTIHPEIFFKLSKFLQDLNSGITILLYVVSVLPKRLDVRHFERILSIFERSITSSGKMVIVLNLSSQLDNDYKSQVIQKYHRDLPIILERHNINLDNVQVLNFDEDRGMFVDVIDRMVRDNPFTPNIVHDICRKKGEIECLRDDLLLAWASIENPEMKEFIKSTYNASQKVVENYEIMSQYNQDNAFLREKIKEQKKLLEQLSPPLNFVTSIFNKAYTISTNWLEDKCSKFAELILEGLASDYIPMTNSL